MKSKSVVGCVDDNSLRVRMRAKMSWGGGWAFLFPSHRGHAKIKTTMEPRTFRNCFEKRLKECKGVRERAQRVKPLPCKHLDLSSDHLFLFKILVRQPAFLNPVVCVWGGEL